MANRERHPIKTGLKLLMLKFRYWRRDGKHGRHDEQVVTKKVVGPGDPPNEIIIS